MNRNYTSLASPLGSITLLSWLILNLSLLCPFPTSAQYQDNIRSTGIVSSNKKIYIVSDTDNSRDDEDIIFGFDGSPGDGDYKERMRLTDEGRLSVGSGAYPEAILHVRSNDNYTRYKWSEYDSGSNAIASFGRGIKTDIGRDYHGVKISAWGRTYTQVGDYHTQVGFNLQSDVFGNKKIRRALSLYANQDALPRVGVALPAGSHFPTETLDVNGAIRIRDTNREHAGTIRYSDGSFLGYNGTEWLNLGAPDLDDLIAEAHNIVFQDNGSIVFGEGGEHEPVNYLVNSLYAPADLQGDHFPIPDAGEDDGIPNTNYNTDDNGTAGGISVVTSGEPRFTVKGNGNTYVHKRLSVGIGGYVPDTVMTVAGAVHIGPDTLQPSTFDYDDYLSDYLLWVERGIVSEDFALANVNDWSDHVFEEDYDLKPLSEVEEFIEKEGHLPGVPSAEEVQDNGYTVHEMTRVLLEKIEELTLHSIAQQKAIEAQQDEIYKLQAQLADMETTGVSRSNSYVKTGF